MNPSPAPARAPTASPPPAGARPREPVAYRRLLTWSWFCVRGALGLFLLGTGLSLLVQSLAQYNVQVLASVLSQLQPQAGAGGAAKGAAPGGYLDGLVPGDLQTAGVLFVALLFTLIVLNLVNRLVQTASDNIMSARLQRSLHDRLLALGPDYHRTHDVGGTQLVVSQFVLGAQGLFKDFLSFPVLRGIGLLTALFLLVGNLQKLGGAPTWMTALLLSTVVVLPVGSWWFSQRVRRAYEQVRESQKGVAEELLNSLSQPLEVQVLRAEPQRSSALQAALRRLVGFRIRASFRNELVTQFQNATPQVLQAVFVLYAIALVLKTGNTAVAGPIVAIYYFVPEAVRPLQEILQFFVGLNASWPQVQSVIEVLEATPAVQDRPGAREAPAGLQPIGLEGASFSYTGNGRRILDAVTHTFAPGKVTALVARSGGGKSTVFNLLCRLQDPQGGCVRLGGADVRELALGSYRRRVTKVSQFPLLVMDTLRVNFRLADAEATDVQIRAACERTGLWAELVKVDGRPADPLDMVLPRSWDQGLSGGQRRVLAITRALLTRPSVLLLDEPTTGVDALWRDRLVGLVQELAGDITVLVVDHNVRDFISEVADVVCVLEEGRFTQVGTPQELAARPGLFQSLYLRSEHEDAEAAPPGPAAALPGKGTP